LVRAWFKLLDGDTRAAVWRVSQVRFQGPSLRREGHRHGLSPVPKQMFPAPGVHDMARAAPFPSFAKLRSLSHFILLSLLIAVFECSSFNAPALAKSDQWSQCRDADIDTRVAACSELIAAGGREARHRKSVAYINRALAFRARGAVESAISDLDEALRLDPKSAPARSERASIRHAKGDWDGAIADYGAAIAAQPKSAAALWGRAEAYGAKGDVDRAIADYDRALQLDKNLERAYVGRARAYLSKGEASKALADLDEAVRLDPKAAPTRIDRCAIHPGGRRSRPRHRRL
jgi:tetratricopeptide (TPR) repeat protein